MPLHYRFVGLEFPSTGLPQWGKVREKRKFFKARVKSEKGFDIGKFSEKSRNSVCIF